MDLFTKVLSKFLIPAAENEIVTYKTTNDINVDTIGNPSKFTLGKYTFYHNRDLKTELLMDLVSLIPIDDTYIKADPEKLIYEFREKYKTILSHSDILTFQDAEQIVKQENDEYDVNSDETLQMIIKQGIGALFITPVLRDQLYKIDLSDMSMFPVRPQFIKYGGCLYMDSKFNILSIDYAGTTYKPEDCLWNNVKLIFRSSLIAASTIKLHAGYSHLMYGSLVPKALSKLPNTHYLAILMRPFTFNNIHAAELAKNVLYGDGKYFNRMFAFTTQGLEDYNNHIFDTFSHITFPEYACSLDSLAKNSPYFEDGNDLWEVIYSFVDAYMTKYFTENDVHINRMLSKLTKISNGKFNLNNNLYELVSFFTNYIYLSTSTHELIGNNIMKYIYDPRMIAVKLRWNEDIAFMYSDVQSYNQTVLIAIATSLMKLPKLMDDFTNNVSKCDSVIISNFRVNLTLLIELINSRNEFREKPYFGAHPGYLEISMNV